MKNYKNKTELVAFIFISTALALLVATVIVSRFGAESVYYSILIIWMVCSILGLVCYGAAQMIHRLSSK